MTLFDNANINFDKDVALVKRKSPKTLVNSLSAMLSVNKMELKVREC